MNVREIVIAHLQAIGADGLCSEDCGCGLDDFMPCGGDAMECKPAKKHQCDRSCGDGCHDVTGEACYRPLESTNEPEETHL